MEDIFKPAGDKEIQGRKDYTVGIANALLDDLKEVLPKKYPDMSLVKFSERFLHLKKRGKRTIVIHTGDDFIEVLLGGGVAGGGEKGLHKVWDIPMSEGDKEDVYAFIDKLTRKKGFPKLQEAIDKKKLGQCYILSGRYVMDHPDYKLVHGTITRKDGYTIQHAWTEKQTQVGKYPMVMVYDPVMDLELPWDAYERLLGAKVEKKYTAEQMGITMLKAKHWGPWELTEDIFKPASSQDVASRKEELMSRPYIKYGQELLDMVKKAFPKVEIRSDIIEEGDFFIEAFITEPQRPADQHTPFAVWVYEDGKTMVLRDVYSRSEEVVGDFTIDYPAKRLLELVLKPIMREKRLMEGLSKKIYEDIFKPATQKDLANRAYDQWKLGRPFPFLQHIDPAEVLAKGYGAVKGVQHDPQESSEIWLKHGAEVIINYDEDEVAKEYLEEIPSMTKEYNESGKTAEEWIKSIKGALIEYSGYSGNEDPAYFWGGNFSYVVFNYEQAQYVVMDSKVMEGDFESFWGVLSIGDPKQEIANTMGYESGDFDQMVDDMERWYDSGGEIVKDPPDPNTDPMQMRFPFMDEPADRR